MSSPTTPLVVLVEDGEADAGTARRMLRRLRPDVDLHHFPSGEALLVALDATTPGAWWPQLFIVDVNLAGRTGIEVLEALKRSPWARVPTIILSGSADAAQVQHCYDIGAAGFLTKPVGTEQLASTWNAITAYWLAAVTPTQPPPR